MLARGYTIIVNAGNKNGFAGVPSSDTTVRVVLLPLSLTTAPFLAFAALELAALELLAFAALELAAFELLATLELLALVTFKQYVRLI
jgi:hypothetical protein